MGWTFCDSCGDYVDLGTGVRDLANNRWRSQYRDLTATPNTSVILGRGEGNAYNVQHSGSRFPTDIPNARKVSVGYAAKVVGSSAHETLSTFFACGMGPTLTAGMTSFVRRNGSIVIATGDGITASEIVVESPVFFNPLEWFYIQSELFVDPVNGYFRVRINNAEDIVFYGDTQRNLPSPHINFVELARGITPGTGNSYIRHIDDIYIHIPDEGEEGFLGDVRVVARMPNADIQTQFERSGGSTNHENISETGEGAPNDSTYVRGEPGDKDLYGLQTIQEAAGYTPRRVHAVQATARVIAEGEVQPFRTIIKSGDIESEGPQSFADASAEPRYIGLHCLDKDPETGLPWTVSRANQIQAGFEVEGGE